MRRDKMGNKSTGIFLIWAIFLTLWFVGLLVDAVMANFQYENSIQSYWELGVKASTLEKKADYLDKFVAAVKVGDLADSSALWLKTPDESVEQNMVALDSLQKRMHEIQGMDVSSFEYQQAMSQITGQEQGEAQTMLKVFKEAWYMNHHFFLWDWMAFVSFITIMLGSVIMWAAFFNALNNY
jgi:hypothetical protein